MSRPVKVGIFLLGGIALFCLGLVLVGSSAHLFGSHFVVYADFNNIQSLSGGSSVSVGGMSAGQVEGIQVPTDPNGKFRLKLSVDQKFRALVRQDSIATIETQGMVGNEFVNIAKGSASSPQCDRCTLPAQEPTSMSAMMKKAGDLMQNLQSTIAEIRPKAESAIGNISSAAAHANSMIAAVQPNVVALSRNANAIVAGIRKGHGAAGKLLTDKTVAADVSTTIANAKQASANLVQTSRNVNKVVSTIQKADLPKVNQTLANTQAITGQMNQAVGTMLAKGNNNENTAEALRETVHSAQQATSNLADDTAAIKRNFFFRGFFHRRGFYNLGTMTPDKYEHSEFVRKPRARVWIPAAGLFTAGPDGKQQLTDAGRKILDQSMSKIIPYLPNNPLVVEGYATAGAPSQMYLESRERALEVSQYLQQHFHLKPDRVGIMPLGAHPLPHMHKKTWDGVCLTLVAWKK